MKIISFTDDSLTASFTEQEAWELNTLALRLSGCKTADNPPFTYITHSVPWTIRKYENAVWHQPTALWDTLLDLYGTPLYLAGFNISVTNATNRLAQQQRKHGL